MEQRDTEQNNTVYNGQSLTGQEENNFYQKHALLSVIAKKTEKIATAIYMVTDFIPESEPLRSELRTLALALVSETRKIASKSAQPQYALSDSLGRTIDNTIIFINLGSTIGLLSDMNGNILRIELEKTRSEIERHFGLKKVFIDTHPGYANVVLKKSFFEVGENEVSTPMQYKGQDSYKGHIEMSQSIAQKTVHAPNRTESFSKKTDLGIKIARRNDVLTIIRSKGKVSIKDIVSILKDTSEKTVQRELLALVREGVLVKEGEKRWSLYRVAA